MSAHRTTLCAWCYPGKESPTGSHGICAPHAKEQLRKHAARRDMKRANYTVVSDNDDMLIIRDDGPWDQHPTVTNAAEQVVAELAPRLKGRRLLYIDSDQQMDELVVKDGKFVGFRPVPR